MNSLYANKTRNRMIAGSIGLLVLLFLLSFIGSQPVLSLLHLAKVNAALLLFSRLSYWLCVFLLWLYAHKVERQDLLLRREAPYSFFIYLLSVLILLLIVFGGSILFGIFLKLAKLNQDSSRMEDLVSIFRVYPLLLVFTSLTAGVTEELMFRGYLQTRFEKLFGNATVAIVVSSLLFGLLHFRYGTIANMLVPFFIGLVFALYYRKYKNLKVLMICHFLWDLAASFFLVNMHH